MDGCLELNQVQVAQFVGWREKGGGGLISFNCHDELLGNKGQ